MSGAELRVAAKAIDGLIDRVRELEAENERLKAEVERLRQIAFKASLSSNPIDHGKALLEITAGMAIEGRGE